MNADEETDLIRVHPRPRICVYPWLRGLVTRGLSEPYQPSIVLIAVTARFS